MTQTEYETILVNNDLQYYANFNSLPYMNQEDPNQELPWMENGDTYYTFI